MYLGSGRSSKQEHRVSVDDMRHPKSFLRSIRLSQRNPRSWSDNFHSSNRKKTKIYLKDMTAPKKNSTWKKYLEISWWVFPRCSQGPGINGWGNGSGVRYTRSKFFRPIIDYWGFSMIAQLEATILQNFLKRKITANRVQFQARSWKFFGVLVVLLERFDWFGFQQPLQNFESISQGTRTIYHRGIHPVLGLWRSKTVEKLDFESN